MVARTPWFRGLGTMYDHETGVAEYAARLPIEVAAVVAVVDGLAVVDGRVVGLAVVLVAVPVVGLPDGGAEDAGVVRVEVVTSDVTVTVG